jgi:exodeoxyribonuclease III
VRIATWNVNGIRARNAQVIDWIVRDRPDVVCLQEIKAKPDQLPPLLFEPEGYWCHWHGAGGYSGVAIFVSKEIAPLPPAFEHPPLDFETRMATVTVDGTLIGSIYVPNGGKDFPAKMRFLEELGRWSADLVGRGQPLALCGDLNVAHTDRDLHPKERKPTVVGQRPEERALFDRILGGGLVDVLRTLNPDREDMFTWWAPWRNMRQRNIGWRIDYVLASQGLASHAHRASVLTEIGTSDHAPVIVEL